MTRINRRIYLARLLISAALLLLLAAGVDGIVKILQIGPNASDIVGGIFIFTAGTGLIIYWYILACRRIKDIGLPLLLFYGLFCYSQELD